MSVFNTKENRAATNPAALSDGVRVDEADAYFAQAQDWNTDKLTRANNTIKTQRWILAVLAAVGVTQAAALALMMPLKRVEVAVVRVDTSTGIVDNIVTLTGEKRTFEESVTRQYINRYVLLRETYYRNQIDKAYDELSILTARDKRQALRKEFEFATPTSMYAQFGERGTRDVTIKTISRISPTVMQVRFFATERVNGIDRVLHYVSTIEYEYLGKPEKETTRRVNALGFVVTSYRRDVEAIVADNAR